jgi:hypothetical protein
MSCTKPIFLPYDDGIPSRLVSVSAQLRVAIFHNVSVAMTCLLVKSNHGANAGQGSSLHVWVPSIHSMRIATHRRELITNVNDNNRLNLRQLHWSFKLYNLLHQRLLTTISDPTL